ncbi:MAG: ROK family protein, partial [Candidatus Omnitrophica bacterium]|nr:ROK family protein [Candidatus Omnitrophota bacterium]
DVNCFGIAERLLGAGKGKQNIIGLTLGTGLGGCLILKGKLFYGSQGSAGEIGHMIIKKGGWKCSCGNNGCLEAYVSTKGTMRVAKEIGCKGTIPTEIMNLAKKGDKKAIRVYQIIGEYLGIGLANLVNMLNPDIIIIGGGIANAGKFIFNPARKTMKENVLSPLAKNTKVVKAKLGEDAGAIGAALLWDIL